MQEHKSETKQTQTILQLLTKPCTGRKCESITGVEKVFFSPLFSFLPFPSPSFFLSLATNKENASQFLKQPAYTSTSPASPLSFVFLAPGKDKITLAPQVN